MFFMRRDRVVVATREGEIGPHRAFGLGPCNPPIPVTVETGNLLRSAGTRLARDEPGTGCQIRCARLSSNRAKTHDQSPWTCIRTRSGHAAEPSKSTMKLQTGATCLDIGCGVGAHMARLLDQGFEVTGIEPSAEMRRLAAKNIPADL